MLKDQSFTGKIINFIESGSSAAVSVKTVVNEYAALFSEMDDARLAEKAQDVRDLGVPDRYQYGKDEKQDFSYENRIILSRHIYPSDLYRLAVEGASGLVLKGLRCHGSYFDSRTFSEAALLLFQKIILFCKFQQERHCCWMQTGDFSLLIHQKRNWPIFPIKRAWKSITEPIPSRDSRQTGFL